MKFSKPFFLLSVLGLMLGCTPQSKETIAVSGSSTVLPVVSRAAEIFRLKHPDVKITVNAGGSGVGVNQVGEKTVQIGMISRDISETEIKKFPNINFVTSLVGKDAVAVAISSEVYDAGITALSFEEIKNIYSGKVDNWKEFGDYDRKILVIDKEKSRGTRHVFMKAVFGDKNAEANGASLVLGSNNEEMTAIVQSDSAIGLLSLAWLNGDVKGAKIKTDAGVIESSIENVISGKYPIARDLHLITDGEPHGIAKDFIDFIKSPEGQDIVKDSGYVAVN